MIIKQHADDIIKAAHIVTAKLLARHVPSRQVLIKPNIVRPAAPPTTTDVKVVEGIIRALEDAGIKEIIIAEGSGTGDTIENFHMLGYAGLGVALVDLDKEKTVTLPVHNHRVWEHITIPELLIDKFIISVPVLKEHSMCGVTISLKNMVGILPAQYYSGYWSYKKSQIHKYDAHGCIADIHSLISPSWAIVDATIGMRGSHISGTPITPPLKLVYGSEHPMEADTFGCELLGRNWKSIKYLRMINEWSKQRAVINQETD
jgi:uncharacterized protein (DUF362 family)